MLLSTTSHIEGKSIAQYHGIVVGETILGANFFKDIFASFTNFLGGRSQAYEESLTEARETALTEMQKKAESMGANAIIGIDIDYETITTEGGSMLMVTCSGTAVTLR
jgi:uncharacterized protein YbjQ (UPF0145 family)